MVAYKLAQLLSGHAELWILVDPMPWISGSQKPSPPHTHQREHQWHD